jgi:hypothetical protein
MKDWIIAIGIVGSVLGAFVGLIILIGSLSDPGPRPTPIFYAGDFVQSRLSGQRGQVVWQRCYRGAESCSYGVRFVGLSMTTSTSLLGPDGPISTEPLNVVEMYEFEMTKVD